MERIKEGEFNLKDEIKDGMSEKLFGRKFTESRDKNVCVSCGENLTPFRDSTSKREWEISCMCQRCQDKVFGR